FPEMMDGRVKTLHPKIHAGILARRENNDDLAKLKEYGIKPIDLVVVNLYPFQEVTAENDLKLDEAIEFIDIGGPTMIRAAAKNYKNVAVLSNPGQYSCFIKEFREKGQVSAEISLKLAQEVFNEMAHYDSLISSYLEGILIKKNVFKERILLNLIKNSDLRYGENPHQRAALYGTSLESGLLNSEKLSGKELSFNNWMDLDSAVISIADFENPAAVIIKHTNPCGIAVAENITEAFSRAHDCDSLSAFGGIIGLNREVTSETAAAIADSGFKECIIAPDYDFEALNILKKNKNLRIMRLNPFVLSKDNPLDFRKISGGFLIQEKDLDDTKEANLNCVTANKPSKSEIQTMLFTWRAVKNVKSNAIVLAKRFDKNTYATVGIGAGQASRIDSVITAIRKAGDKAKGAVLSSDAFFPMPDSIEAAHSAGIRLIIQPGGSIKDSEVIEKANQLGIVMVFTGIRHFCH
ncbi:MAG TPA: bifunctional phosphoribosylaminoimidazolecarboxamide formyltransferase/IMP cyclohydrolase, partial [Candidatus Omnitrophica bacterium]|nr:bifunctional phosphoribosylaminoimidazolecarboxamide formyltransferase/IMP cyclohydrolase [Candidatus Omnitrophota bacterium]